MEKLDEIYEAIIGKVSLVPYKRSLWQIIFSKISKLFGKKSETVFGDGAKNS